MAGIKAKRQEALRDFVDLCETVGFHPEAFQVRVAGALLGPEREKLITLPRKNGKSRLTGAFAAWHLLRTPEAQVVVVANSKEQAEIIDRYARQVAMHPSVEAKFEPRFRELRGPGGSRLVVKSADADKALGLTPNAGALRRILRRQGRAAICCAALGAPSQRDHGGRLDGWVGR